MTLSGPARARLAGADNRLRNVPRRSLDPVGRDPTPLLALVSDLAGPDDDGAVLDAIAIALSDVAEAQITHFPENIFWDFDAMAAQLLAAARTGGVEHVRVFHDLSLRLQAAFGCRSTIRFRYVHDFAHGFDWERWVAGEPGIRAGIGPFDLPFLQRVLTRGEEIASLIAEDDPLFPRLAPGAFRNPFPFSRRPEHEVALHLDLAARGALPVLAWRADALPDWRHDRGGQRAARAAELGIPPP